MGANNTDPNFIDDIRALLSLLKQPGFRGAVPFIDRCDAKIHVIGNGPSLASTLKSEVALGALTANACFCVNNFSSSEFYRILKPKYYALFDPNFWRQDLDDTYRQEIMGRYRQITRDTEWSMRLFIPFAAKGSPSLVPLADNPNIEVRYVNNSIVRARTRVLYYMYKRNLAMPIVQNVLVAAVFLAMNLGYRKIYLHGADHTWTRDLELREDNIVCIRQPHFYDTSQVDLVPWLKEPQTPFKMDEILFALSRMFAGYRELADYASYRSANIYNCSRGTFIDAFERRDIDNLVA